MAVQIERKFLLKNTHWKQYAKSWRDYSQGYLTTPGGKSSIRVRICDDRAWLNIKSATLGMQRAEFDYEIPLQDAQEMLNTLCLRPVIKKRRYYVPYSQHTWEVDEFGAENAGLVVAEIELSDVDEAFDLPEWVGREVTDDPRYYNVSLVDYPYSEWKHE